MLWSTEVVAIDKAYHTAYALASQLILGQRMEAFTLPRIHSQLYQLSTSPSDVPIISHIAHVICLATYSCHLSDYQACGQCDPIPPLLQRAWPFFTSAFPPRGAAVIYSGLLG